MNSYYPALSKYFLILKVGWVFVVILRLYYMYIGLLRKKINMHNLKDIGTNLYQYAKNDLEFFLAK